MAEAEVRLLQTDLNGATEAGRARDILQQLKGTNMTFAMLMATKVAKTVKAAKKKFPELRPLIKELIKSWQQLDPKRAKAAQAQASAVSHSSFDSERDSVRESVYSVLETEIGALARELEQELHDTLDKATYRVKARSIKFNLSKNSALKARVVAGDISIKELATMSSADMASEEHQRLREQVIKEATEARRSDWLIVNNAPTEGMFKCGKCHSKRTITDQKQTRGADEPMTTFVKCLNCDNSWKF